MQYFDADDVCTTFADIVVRLVRTSMAITHEGVSPRPTVLNRQPVAWFVASSERVITYQSSTSVVRST